MKSFSAPVSLRCLSQSISSPFYYCHRQCTSAILFHSKRTVVNPSTPLLATANRTSRPASSGLWSSHHRANKITSATTFSSKTSLRSDGNFSASNQRTDAAATGGVSCTTKKHLAGFLNNKTAPRHTHSEEISAEMSTSFSLDPPFTPVSGESAWVKTQQGTTNHCLYACQHCHATLFDSRCFARGSRVGTHSTGWPTFTAPHSPHAVRLRTVLQKAVVAQVGAADGPLESDRSRNSRTTTTTRTENLSQSLQVRVPDAGMVQRGLPVEGDVVRPRGRPITPQHTQSWREACLRDENHRADPAIVLGCCGRCGVAVCQVTHSASEGSRYVATPSRIAAKLDNDKVDGE